MEKRFDIVFNSEKENGKSFQIANGLIITRIATVNTTAGITGLSAMMMLSLVMLNSF